MGEMGEMKEMKEIPKKSKKQIESDERAKVFKEQMEINIFRMSRGYNAIKRKAAKAKPTKQKGD